VKDDVDPVCGLTQARIVRNITEDDLGSGGLEMVEVRCLSDQGTYLEAIRQKTLHEGTPNTSGAPSNQCFHDLLPLVSI
jgi:hypothetical protein